MTDSQILLGTLGIVLVVGLLMFSQRFELFLCWLLRD